MTLAEHDALLKTQGRYDSMLEVQRDKEIALREREAEWREAEKPLIEAMGEIGLKVESVWNLVNTPKSYSQAVGLLLDHLQRPYPERVREGIARALAIPEARIGWRILLDLFRQERGTGGSGLKWALSCALAAAADDSVFEDVTELLRERRHGESRLALLAPLSRSKNPRSREILLELEHDPELKAEVRKLT